MPEICEYVWVLSGNIIISLTYFSFLLFLMFHIPALTILHPATDSLAWIEFDHPSGTIISHG